MLDSLGHEIVPPIARHRHWVLYEPYGIATDLDPSIGSAECSYLFSHNQMIEHGPVDIPDLTRDEYYRNFHIIILRGDAIQIL